MTGRCGFGYSYVSKPVLIRIRFPDIENTGEALKRAPNAALRLTHVCGRRLVVPPPFNYSDTLSLLSKFLPRSTESLRK